MLIAAATGLCTGDAIIDAFTRTSMDLPRSTVVTGALIVGGIPCAIGIAMAFSAMTGLRRDGRNQSKCSSKPDDV
jgi:hypothetical protein